MGWSSIWSKSRNRNRGVSSRGCDSYHNSSILVSVLSVFISVSCIYFCYHFSSILVLNAPNVKHFELHSVYERCYTNKVYYYYYYYYVLLNKGNKNQHQKPCLSYHTHRKGQIKTMQIS